MKNIKKNSAPVAKNAAELGSNLRKTDSEKVTVIHGNLVLEKNTTFDNSIRVEGDIVGKDDKRYNLVVNGSINVWNINAWHINANGNIRATGNINATNIITCGNIRTDGDIKASNISARNVVAWNIKVWDIDASRIHTLNLNAHNINVIENIIATYGNIHASGNINARDIEVRNIVTYGNIYTTGNITTSGNIDARDIHALDINARDIDARDIDARSINAVGEIHADFIICENLIQSKRKKLVYMGLIENRSTYKRKEVKR